MQSLIEPLVVSWGWHPEIPAASKFVQEQEWQGTRDIAAYLSVPAAIEFMRAHDWDAVRAECHEIARYARGVMTEWTDLEPPSPDSRDWFAQMISLPIPQCEPKALKKKLYDEYKIEVPILTWENRHWARVSIQGYNTRADVDTLCRALRDVFKT